MNRLLYSSISVVALSEPELDTLLGSSRRANAVADVTGSLVHVTSPESSEAAFVQLLEGEKGDLERTYARIKADDLHTGLTVLLDEEIPGREFGDWTMRLAEVSPKRLREIVGRDRPGVVPERLMDLLHDPAAMLELVHRLAASPSAHA